MKRCRECKAQYPDDAQFCPVEGSVLDNVVGTVASNQVIDNKYRLGKVLGGNRTGTVYEAFRMLDESCFAVKLVHKQIFPTPILASRAQRELKNLATVTSPNVMQIHDFGLHRACIWLSMDLCPENSLASTLSETKYSLEESLSIIEQLAEGLEAAAKTGIIHRDLSPKNILIDDKNQVTLINFSIPVPGKDHVGVTGYMAPEQLKGNPPDLRSNIFSLATILYHCIEGKRAFDGDAEAVALAHQSLPAFEVCKEEHIQKAMARALDVEPSKRFMTFREFAKVLRTPLSSMKELDPMSNKEDKSKTDVSKNKTLMGFASPEVAKMKKEIDDLKKQKAEAMEANAVGTPAPRAKRKSARVSAPPPIPKGTSSSDTATPKNVAKSNEVVKSDSKETLSTTPKDVGTTTAKGLKKNVENALENEKPQVKPEKIAMKPIKKTEKIVAETAKKSQSETEAVAKETVAKPDNSAKTGNATTGVSKEEPMKPEEDATPAALAAPVLGAPKLVKETSSLKSPKTGKNAGGKGKASAQPAKEAAAEKKGKFRETMWFKKGELDEAAAEAASEKRKRDELASDKADEMAIDERYNDDGSITAQDKNRLSLRTGATLMEPVKHVVSRNDVSESDLINEMKGNRKYVFGGIAAGLLLLIVIVVTIL